MSGERHTTDLDLLRLYREDVAEVDVPDDTRMRELAALVHVGTRAQQQLDARSATGTSPADDLAALVEDGRRARDRLLVALLPTVLQVADRVVRRGAAPGVLTLDLAQTGNEALVGAIDSYDTSAGWSLRAHVERVVWTAMYRAGARDRTIRISIPALELSATVDRELAGLPSDAERWTTAERAAAIGRAPAELELVAQVRRLPVSLDALLDSRDGETALAHLGDESDLPGDEGSHLLDAALASVDRLPVRHRAILRLYTGLGTGEPLGQAAIAAAVGVTPQRVSQILAKSAARVRDMVAAVPQALTTEGVDGLAPESVLVFHRSLVDEYLERALGTDYLLGEATA